MTLATNPTVAVMGDWDVGTSGSPTETWDAKRRKGRRVEMEKRIRKK
jgi:hypothetical protein